ncbi:MAG: TIGR04282 family arsenosugar biosynthesis glycosyltransferase [Gammaproteobacteria bacterium]
MEKENIIICFCKHPEDGLVKSRLAKDLGAQRATKIYTTLLQETLNNMISSRFKIILYCYPDTLHPALEHYRDKYSLTLEKQHDGNLGMKMYKAIMNYLNENTNVVLIGSDCLEIDAAYIQKAFEELNSGNDIVLSPTEDGGYALIGMNKIDVSIFQNIAWSTNQVLNQTKEKASKLNWKISCLPKLRDLDVLADYEYFSHHEEYSHLF